MTKRQKASTHSGTCGGITAEGERRRTESLWAHYRRTRSAKTRNLLVERYRGIVEAMAAAMAGRLPRCVDVQDLVHAGVWGLMHAIEGFEPERGIHFLGFMRIRVRGAMLDELRGMDYVSRLARHRQRELGAAQAKLRQALNREPSDAELAGELGVSELILRRRFAPAPLPTPNAPRPRRGRDEDDGEGGGMEDLVDEQIESPVEALNRRDLLEKIRTSLQPIEWKVLELHYLRGLSGKEVARRLRLSPSRICQIHGRVLSRLKTRLAPLH